MSTPRSTWQPVRHDPILRLEDNLWAVQGDVPDLALRRWMVLVKLSDGRIVIHNGVALDDEAMTAVESFGELAFLIVPNALHRLDAAAYKTRYPRLEVLCPAAAHKRVCDVVAVDAHFEALANDPALTAEPLSQARSGEAAFIVTSGTNRDRTTIVFSDLLFNVPHGPGFGGLMLRLLGSSGGPRVTRIGRWFVVKNKVALAEQYRKLASLPGLVRVIPGHGDVIEGNVPSVLEAVANRL